MARQKKSTRKSSQQQEIPVSIKPRRNSLFTTIAIIVFLLLLVSLISGCTSLLLPESKTGNVALIPLYGVISPASSSGTFEQETVDSGAVIEMIREADANDQIGVIVIDINSGGGTPVASAEIARAVKDAEKPTIAWVRDLGASGAYWVASASDTIVAHELSTTGSIGVTGSYLEFSGLLDDYNVTYNRQVSGYYKDMGSPYKDMTPSEERIYKNMLDKMHELFIEDVAENRNMSVEQLRDLADGRVYLGIEAKENGLVDVLGSQQEVRSIAKEHIGEDVEFRDYKPQKNIFSIFPCLSKDFARNIGEGIGSQLGQERISSNQPRI
ncbi:MAG: signal peptide peptidase SppA [Candidatus Woesearchaeota archaeon]